MSASGAIASLYHSWVESINGQEWDKVLGMMRPAVILNDRELRREEVLSALKYTDSGRSGCRIEIDMLITDEEQGSFAARIIHRRSQAVSQAAGKTGLENQPLGWTEYGFYESDDAKISRITSLSEAGIPSSSASAMLLPNTSWQKDDRDMAQMYRCYIDSINNLSMQTAFPNFCQPYVTHNGRRLSIDQYRLFIESSFEEIQGLYFNLRELIVDRQVQRIAARIKFTGRPTRPFRGIEPTGREVLFHEHVFYQLKDGKIDTVSSILDLEAYESSMNGSGAIN